MVPDLQSNDTQHNTIQYKNTNQKQEIGLHNIAYLLNLVSHLVNMLSVVMEGVILLRVVASYRELAGLKM